MSEHELELRLRAVAHALDAQAPVLDPATLHASAPRRVGRWVVAIAVLAAVAGTVAAPVGVSALTDLFDVDSVSELGPVPADVAPAFGGRQVQLTEAQRTVAFRIRTIASLGVPEAVYVRDDIVGGMVTVAYHDGRTRLTQWALADVSAGATVVPSSGAAEEVELAGRRALWIEGTARGTFTVTGADRAIHHELFDVAAGALLWQDDGSRSSSKAPAARSARLCSPQPSAPASVSLPRAGTQVLAHARRTRGSVADTNAGPMSAWNNFIALAGAAAGLAAVVYFVGAVTLWARFRTAALPADIAIEHYPRTQVAAIGVRGIAVVAGLIVLAVGLLYLVLLLVGLRRRGRRCVART